jgi:hypothetical protein
MIEIDRNQVGHDRRRRHPGDPFKFKHLLPACRQRPALTTQETQQTTQMVTKFLPRNRSFDAAFGTILQQNHGFGVGYAPFWHAGGGR